MSKKKHNFLCCLHATRVLFLDDSKIFLKIIEAGLKDKVDLLLSSDYKEALEFLHKDQEHLEELTCHLLEEKTISDQLMEITIGNLYGQIYNPSRFNYISVLVVDYKMPDIDGIEFCRLIKNSNIKVILLTAVDDKSAAIQAFNDGIIHKFFLKDASNLNQLLLDAIRELQYQYFLKLCLPVYNNLPAPSKSFFDNSVYWQLFEQVKEEANAAEYYLIDRFGSFLFLDATGEPTWLVIRDEKEMHDYVDMASEQEADKGIILPLENREKLLFQLTEKDVKLPIEYWVDYLFEAEKLDGFYYSVIKAKTKNYINWNDVCSYDTVRLTG